MEAIKGNISMTNPVMNNESSRTISLNSRLSTRGKSDNSTSRVRSASVGRKKDDDLRGRYWAFLFDNLHRAVDEIYQNCEKDESVVECKEAIMVLENYTREFNALIQWLNLNKHLESIPSPQRPTSLAWEVRKSVPAGERLFWNAFFSRKQNNNNNNNIKREIIVNKQIEGKTENNDSKNNINKEKDNNNINENENVKIIEESIQENNENSIEQEKNKIDEKISVENEKNKELTKIDEMKNKLNKSKSMSQMNSNVPVSKTPMSIVPVNKTPMSIVPVSKTVSIVPLNRTAASIVANGIKTIKTSSVIVQSKRVDSKLAQNIHSKNYIKETNASRAKNVKNTINSTNQVSKNVLLARNSSGLIIASKNIISSKENLNKPKKVKDADGWEVVRGRQRFKNSPPKVIIIDDKDQMIKTISDGTVIAVTAASQTTDSWPNWDQIDPRMCATWPVSNQTTESDFVLRTPGRALKMHEKLSSPSRKRSLSETMKRHEEKLAKAQEVREKLLEEKAGKFKGIVEKVKEMKVKKEEQQMLLKMSMEKKLRRAEEKRLQQLKKIIKKAHDEESKVIEIQFINSLEAQNKKHDILIKEKDHEARLADLLEERQRKLEEKTAKEAAAEERRKALEEERLLRLTELQEKRKQKDAKIEQQQYEKEKERIEMAREKARDRQERISAINAAYQANVEELQKKILMKQEESKRRHEENMEQIRQKALELSVKSSSAIGNDDTPSGAPYETNKFCTLCQVLIGSEVFLYGHLRGSKHQEAIKEKIGGRMPVSEELEQFNIKHIVEASVLRDKEANISGTANISQCENERLKASKKRSKKLKQRLISKGAAYETSISTKDVKKTPGFQRLSKLAKDLLTFSNDDKITGSWPNNMVHSVERIINELEKLIKNNYDEQMAFYSINGLPILCKLLYRIIQGNNERPTCLPDRVNSKLCFLILTTCNNCENNSLYLLQSNCIMSILDVFLHRCNLLDTSLKLDSSTSTTIQSDSVISALCRLLAGIFNSINNSEKCDNLVLSRIQDVISFAVSSGMVDKLSCLMSNIRGPIDQTVELAYLLESILKWINSMIKMTTLFENDDPTQLLITLQITQMAGVISLVYGVLLHSGTPQRFDENGSITLSSTHELPLLTLSVVQEALKLCNQMSIINLSMVQNILGSEGLSLQLRHICSYLIWYCSQNESSKSRELLHEVILLIGNFVVLNKENQTVIQLGQRPTILQQLCSLPFEYFSDEKLTRVLFPTLIANCFLNNDNRTILEQEMSTLMLAEFIESMIVEMQLKAVDTIGFMKSENSSDNERWSLASRFPKNKWNQAKEYFESPITN